tara:strand:- start:403 stop:1215 length:813 start_codon:yes stop_codon:yes gene_type:complete
MITTELYYGQGHGDQTWVYVTTRYLADTLGYEFGIGHPERWKLPNLDIDFGKKVIGGESPEGGPPTKLPEGIDNYYKEKHTYHPNFHDCNISDIDPKVFEIPDNTKLEGLLHYGKLFDEHGEKFKEWLDFQSVMDRNPVVPGKVICNIRGGEYKSVPDLLLPKKYWDMALERLGNPEVEIVTDDPAYALTLIPNGKIFSGSMIEHFENLFTAETLIISNSAFGVFPAALGPSKTVIAPKYWSRWNVSDGFWAMEMDKCSKFTYIDREGNE